WGREFRFRLELFGLAAPRAAARRHERPEGAPLVAVDPVDGTLPALDLEDGGEELPAEALLLEPLRDCVDCCDLVLELGVAHDDPRVAELVLATLELRARVRRDAIEQLLQVVLRPNEVAGRERLEADPGGACCAQAELRVERHCRRGECEETLTRRRGQLLLAEKDVPQTRCQNQLLGSSTERGLTPHLSNQPGGP